MNNMQKQYEEARKQYQDVGVDTDKALEKLGKIPISIHCWQGDDVTGFEYSDIALGGGLLTTGNFKGKPRNLLQLRQDIEKAFTLIPGPKKINLHPIYGDFKGKKVDRDQIGPEHFESWADWAQKNNAGIDFNPTTFAHKMADSGYTISDKDKKIRNFWIEHARRCREISNYFGSRLGKTCIYNIWVQDGAKDTTLAKYEHRMIMKEALDEIFSEKYPESNVLDALESKLFGLGSESFTVGSLDFYLAYAAQNGKLITFDTGHFHPTELVSDKISAVLPFLKGIMLHLSRGIRWDSDHVTIMSDEVIEIMKEIVRAGATGRVYIGTDFFDSSINRIGAWAIGARAVIKALLVALLEPASVIKKYEDEGLLFARLGMLEDSKTMPFGAVWNYHCLASGVPADAAWIGEVLKYEAEVLDER